MFNVSIINVKVLKFILFATAIVYSSQTDSIPIAEYCYRNSELGDPAVVYLLFEKTLQEPDNIQTCSSYSHCNLKSVNWLSKFLVKDDLKIELGVPDKVILGGWSSMGTSTNGAKYPIATGVVWYFVDTIPIYSKYNLNLDSLNIIAVEWNLNGEAKPECELYCKTNFSGSYFIRITGTCNSSAENNMLNNLNNAPSNAKHPN